MSKYQVGDSVVIVGTSKCSYGDNDEMRALIGRIATITGTGYKCFHIDLDHSTWKWDDTCFAPAIPDLPLFEVSNLDSLLALYDT